MRFDQSKLLLIFGSSVHILTQPILYFFKRAASIHKYTIVLMLFDYILFFTRVVRLLGSNSFKPLGS